MSKSMRRKMAGIMSTAMIVTSLPVVANVAEVNESIHTYISDVEVERTTAASIKADKKIFDASELQAGELTEDMVYGDFVIKATSDKKVTIDKSKQIGEYYREFSQRVKFGGKGTTNNRSVKFTISQPAEVTLYALSSSDTVDRPISIYNEQGEEVVAGLKAPGLKNITDPDKKIPALTASLSEAGTYYIYSTESVNLYYASVIEGEVETPDFEDGIKPAVKQAELAADLSTLDITVEGEIVNPETDKLWVKLYNSKGSLEDYVFINTLKNGEATVNLTPKEEGSYTIVCESVREGISQSYKSDTYEIEVELPLGEVNFANVKTGKIQEGKASLKVDWDDTPRAENYRIELGDKEGQNYILIAEGLTESYYEISDLTVGETYTVRVTATDGKTTNAAVYTKKVANREERFLSAAVGSGASGSVTENEDGSVTIDAPGGKLADSEDGFMYYYTEIDPATENFTLTATFVVEDSANKDNQSGFGIMAIDTFEDKTSAARYFNSAGAMVRKYSNEDKTVTRYGIPGGYFVTGYTDGPTTSSSSRKLIDTDAFDWNYKADYVTETNANPPKFENGDEITLTLRKSNTGFHAWMSNDTTNEVICYEPELLLQQDSEKYYVGLAAGRKIKITVKDIQFTTIAPENDAPKVDRPMQYVEPSFSFDSASTSSSSSYEAGFKANFKGTIDVVDSKGMVVAKNIAIDPSNDDTFRAVANLSLNKGDNSYKAIFTPLAKEEQGDLLGAMEDLKSYEPIEVNFNISYKTYGTEANAIYVSPSGSEKGKGTKASPLDFQTAVNYAQPGQEIVLLGGTYKPTRGIIIERGNNGTADKPIVIMSDPNERAVFDLSECSTNGILMAGDYWHVYDIELMNSQNGKRPVHISGNHNIAEKLTIHDNADTGLQISGSSAEPKSMWPSYNLVQSCEVYNSCDAQGNDADGFAAKLTAGDGNVFRYCIAHHNIDDGWDLYAKSTTGLIGEVIVEKSVAYANGKLTYGDRTGEGNGFKLGGESMPVAHILRDSISFDNLANGVFSNSNPSCQVSNTISFGNGGRNLYLNTNAASSSWTLDHFISYKGEVADESNLKTQGSLESETNYLNGKNTQGETVKDSWFESLDTSIKPVIAADGSIEMGGLLQLTSEAPEGAGTLFGPNPNPTVITIGKEIASTTSSGGSSSGSSSSSKPSSGGTVATESEANKELTEAINSQKVPTLKVDKDNQLALGSEEVKTLKENVTDLNIAADSTSLTMNHALLKELLGEDISAMKVQVAPADKNQYEKLQTAVNALEGMNLVGDISQTVSVAVTTSQKVAKFNEPAKVTFDLSKVTVEDAAKLTLVKYVINEEGAVSVVKLGGSYDADTKTFTARISEAGEYAVVSADELQKLTMKIGDKTSAVNEQKVTNDVAPQIIEGTTMVPVRFIAENLGAEVKWDSKKKQVNITLGDELVTVNSNDGMVIKDSRTLVPIRYVSEQLGAHVLWVPSTKEIEIVK